MSKWKMREVLSARSGAFWHNESTSICQLNLECGHATHRSGWWPNIKALIGRKVRCYKCGGEEQGND